ncbi:MAG: FAD-dependent protein [Chitinophagales bacterium]
MMTQEINLAVTPEQAVDDETLKRLIISSLGKSSSHFNSFRILRRSIDARNRNIKINLRLQLFFGAVIPVISNPSILFQQVAATHSVVIVGAGPAGLFAALRLLEDGIKPIIIERGKTVRDRRRDLAALNRNHLVNPDSNYCFGEGGAGTYSDGKLYTRSTKRGDVEKILQLLVQHGAGVEIMIDAHPHIGTNKLPQIIERIRGTILEYGGEIYFNTRLKDIVIENGSIRSIATASVESGEEKEIITEQVILATGHSARDIFHLLHDKNILIEPKPFAMGVRVEHPQSLIDWMQYHCDTVEQVKIKRKLLPASSYSFVHQSEGRGVYSFCMCPGGIIAPCATAMGEVVVNGWSPSKRNNPFANSGVVVSIELEDLVSFNRFGNLAGLNYQRSLEQMACNTAGGTQTAPAQRLVDFVNGKISSSLPDTSYQPGIISAPLHELLPPSISTRLQEGFAAFGEKMKGYFTNEAVVHGVESRTSSPVRIPRDKTTMEHPQVSGLYPVGEGAGFAGGIISAAIDGQNAAACIALKAGKQ